MRIDNIQNINSKPVVLPDGNTYQIIRGEMYQVINQQSLDGLGFLKKAFKKLKKFAANKVFTKFGGKFGISPWAVGAGVAAYGVLSKKKKKKKRRGAQPVAQPIAQPLNEQAPQPISNTSPLNQSEAQAPFIGDEKPQINWLLLGGIGLVGYVLMSNKK